MRFLALLGLAVLVAMATFEVAMHPTSAERTQLLLIFGGMAAITGIAAATLTRWTGRLRSLRLAVVGIGITALVVVGAVTAVSAQLMFITAHDLTLIFIVVGFGIVLGVLLATTVAEPMERDLLRIRNAVGRIGEGDFSTTTGVVRSDELGEAARAIDGMARRLSAVEAERARSEVARRHFLAAVGHDLRSPLAALRATVEALEDGLAPDPGRYLGSMRADIDALGHLIDDLFLLATIEAGKLDFDRASVDVTELADESIEVLAPVAAQQGVVLRLDAPSSSVQAIGGSRELGRAIRNLVDNAIRYAPRGTAVVVSVENGDGALVRVTDDGPGFAADMVDEVFDGFVTGDPARSRLSGGAGLGLAIARGVVHAHGGSIWVEPGPGGRVAFRLPARTP